MKTRTRKIILAIVAVVAVFGVTAVAIAQRSTDAPGVWNDDGTIDLGLVKEDAIKGLFDDNGSLINPHARRAQIASDHPGGFGGYYFDGTVVYIYMQDPDRLGAAEAAFGEAYSGDREVTEIRTVQGKHSLDQLYEWYVTLNSAMPQAGIEAGSASLMLRDNAIEYGLIDLAQTDQLYQLMAELSIPKTAVNVYQGGFILETEWDPRVGGIQWEEAHGGEGLCTIGFVTERDSVEGVVVASHCTQGGYGTFGGI